MFSTRGDKMRSGNFGDGESLDEWLFIVTIQ